MLGLVACVVAVLLVGVVIGRLTMTRTGSEDVFLHGPVPSPLAKTQALPRTTRADRPALRPVAKEPAVSDPEPAKQPGRAYAKPTTRPGTMIEGDESGGDTRTLTAEETTDDSPHSATLESEVVELVNRERTAKGCRPLRVDGRLTNSARLHSREMAESGQLTHNSPNGTSPWQRMARAGYAKSGAENIARGFLTAQTAVQGWMGSSGHRRNILDCRLVATGVGVSLGPEGPWWTQDFGY